ncbi:autotransporter outer membrane beta-barrel domain-containing protein [Pseudomonas sp. Leaf129]|uniref:autotransporter outer membrane beta-barrel domain-containing protein n=1 Tax=Pseudomonas sp. Leaf129 TaxID=1736268 RepID=UPI000AAEDA7A|nr:autotransporter outer membrane beta-barrel domain-containing protein [Pseudomonas sp. Leaf129]
MARELNGDTATVGLGAPVESWKLSDGAVLTVESGGITQGIVSGDSTVIMNGAAANSNSTFAVHLTQSQASIDGSRLTSSARSALNVTRSSTVSVSNSVIEGIARGVNVAWNSTAVLSNTTVYGRDDGQDNTMSGGFGLTLVNGNAQLDNNTQVTGDKHGVMIIADRIAGRESNLLLDNAHLLGLKDSAIRVDAPAGAGIAHANIRITNGSTLTGGNGVILEVNGGTSADVTVDNSSLVGNVVVGADSVVSLNLDDQARLTGGIGNLTEMSVNNGSLWRLTQDSNVKNLTLNNGRVDLGGSDGAFHQLELDTLQGKGIFGLNTDLAAGQGDKLVISGEAAGNHQLAIRNTGTDVAEGQAPHEVVRTGGGTAQFDLVGGQVDLGTYVYDLQKQGNDWFLVQRPGEVVAPGTRSVLGLFSAAPTVWYGEASTLRSRMGELRMGSGEGGVWSRAYGNRYDVSAGGGVDYQQTQQGVSVGADGALALDNGRMLLGVTGGYSRSDLDLAAGTTGSVDSYYLGLYGTWLADDGYYVDALMKLNRFQNEADVSMSDGQRSAGNYNNHGVGVSVEAGKRFELDDGVFVSPFAQVSALWVQGEKYSLDNGMQARSNKADSLLGKVGTQVGQTHQIDSGGRFDYYAKAALAHEFADNNQVKINGNRFSNDLSGSRAELGIGAAVQLSDRLQLHTDLEYAKGRNMEQPWGLSLGARYDF